MFLNFIVKPYMIAYNAFQLYGWSIALFNFGKGIAASEFDVRASQWTGETAAYITFFQWLMLMEVVHPALGMVRGDPLTALLQVISRIMVVILANVLGAPILQDGFWVNCVIFAWSLTEVIRYSSYIASLLDVKIYVLTWLRYTLFIGLYPMGVSGELGVFAGAIPFLERLENVKSIPSTYGGTQQWLVESGMYPFLLKIGWTGVIMMYVIGFPYLYLYMVMRRKSVLGGKKNKNGSKGGVSATKKTN